MVAIKHIGPVSHVVDTLGSTKGRDQPIMSVEKALKLVELLDDSVFADHNTVILDPFCKAGEVLLAAALKSCLVQKSLSQPLVSVDEISHELYSGRYYALSPDERHYLLSLRTFYGNDRSHDKLFTQHIQNGNYLSDKDGKLDKDKFQKELSLMIDYIQESNAGCKIVVIGNPPYQEADGGYGKSAKPIYNLFAEALIDCPDISQIVLVLPARWFSGGKGLDNFRKRILQSKQVRNIQYFKNSLDIFPTVEIKGGICFLHWDKFYEGNTVFSDDFDKHMINLSQHNIILDDPCSFSIVEKIQRLWTGRWVSDVAWARKPFGLATNYFQKHREATNENKTAVPCLSNGRIVKYVEFERITKNKNKIYLWKVAIPRAYGAGMRRCTIPVHQIFLIKKGTICTETYNIIDCCQTKEETEKLIKYLQTNFSRYLLGLRKLTQDIPRDRWSWVPYMDTSRDWIDEELFDFFNFSKAERQHIRQKVQEWS